MTKLPIIETSITANKETKVTPDFRLFHYVYKHFCQFKQKSFPLELQHFCVF